MKAFAAFFTFAVVLVTSVAMAGGIVPGVSGHPYAAGDNCYQISVSNPQIGWVTDTCNGSSREWILPLPITNSPTTVMVYANISSTSNGAFSCFAVSADNKGVLVSSVGPVNSPTTGYRSVAIGGITVPVNGVAFVECQTSQAGQSIVGAEWF